MIFTADDIRHQNFDEILKLHNLACDRQEEYYREFASKENAEYEAKLSKFKDNYPVLYIEPAVMTTEEKRMLCTIACNNELKFAIWGGCSNAEIKEIERRYSNPENFDEEELKSFQRMLLINAPSDPNEYLTKRLREVEEERGIVCIKFSRQDIQDQDKMKGLEAFALRLLGEGKQVRIAVNDAMITKSNSAVADYLYDEKDLAKIVELNNRLAEAGMKKGIVFDEYRSISSLEDYDKSWKIEDVVKANSELDNIAANIKKMNLSPFETMLFIHSYLTKNFAYAEGGTEECRVVPGIIKTHKIVCSGYASFVKTIVDKLNMPELKCEIVGCEIYKKSLTYEFEGGHCHNIIQISDPKYGIEGYYVEDACWDAKTKEFARGRGFSHCLYPVTDLEHFNGMHYVQKDSANRLSALMFDPESMQDALVEMGKVLRGEKGKSAFQEYRERRAKVKNGADVVRRCGKQSKPISQETFRNGLTNVHQRVLGEVSQRSVDIINQDMQNSIMFACAGFDKGATTEFASDRKLGKEFVTARRNSLKSNDGREG